MTDDRSRMTDARLAEIKALLDDSRTAHAGTWRHDRHVSNGEVADLFAEVERLQAREAGAQEIVERVASGPLEKRYGQAQCVWCNATWGPPDFMARHARNCPVNQARAWLVNKS